MRVNSLHLLFSFLFGIIVFQLFFKNIEGMKNYLRRSSRNDFYNSLSINLGFSKKEVKLSSFLEKPKKEDKLTWKEIKDIKPREIWDTGRLVVTGPYHIFKLARQPPAKSPGSILS